jgi:hypothetical protein
MPARSPAAATPLTSARHREYLEMVEAGFIVNADYAQLVKLLSEVPDPVGRYSPAQIQGGEKVLLHGRSRSEAHLDQLRRAPKI